MEPDVASGQDAFQKGICYVNDMSADACYGTTRSRKSLEILRDLGVEWVSLTPYGYQPDPHEPEIARWMPIPYCVKDYCLMEALEDARELGFKVMLKPHIWVGEDGDLRAIRLRDKSAWQEWFRNYRDFIVDNARLAEAYEVEILCIGVELEQTTLNYETEWREIIQEVRKVYHGSLVYAANWGKEFEHLGFWDDLDFIGLNFYYPLSDEVNPSYQDLQKQAQEICRRIEKVHDKFKRPVILTEVGFRSVAQTARRPWDWKSPGALDLEIQAQCYQVIFETFCREPWIAGLYWWKWWSDPELGGLYDRGFTPRKKPAEEVLALWYRTSIAVRRTQMHYEQLLENVDQTRKLLNSLSQMERK